MIPLTFFCSDITAEMEEKLEKKGNIVLTFVYVQMQDVNQAQKDLGQDTTFMPMPGSHTLTGHYIM